MMFKKGQKVVYIGKGRGNPTSNYPEQNEIITIKCACNVHKNAWDIVEYLYDLINIAQSFSSKTLRPIDESFAEEVIANVQKNIQKKERELVEI